MRAIITLALAIAAFAGPRTAVHAQTLVTPRGEAQNVRLEQREEGIVHISYDLISSDPRAVFAVRLEAAQEGGPTINIRPQSVSGDAGDGVRPGTGKRIVWDSGKDVERVQIDRLRLRIIATGAPLGVEAPVPPTAPVEPATKAPAPQPKPIPQPSAAAPPAKGGGGIKWLLIGGGAAAAGGIALAAGGGGGGRSTPSPSGVVTTPATIDGRWSGSVSAVPASHFGGQGVCNYTMTFTDVRISFSINPALVVSDGILSVLATEAVEDSCQFRSVAPPHVQAYVQNTQFTTAGSVTLTFRPNDSNVQKANAEFFAALNGGVLSATLTFQRTDQSAPIAWRIQFPATLNKSQ